MVYKKEYSKKARKTERELIIGTILMISGAVTSFTVIFLLNGEYFDLKSKGNNYKSQLF
jgi:hypothetical protein